MVTVQDFIALAEELIQCKNSSIKTRAATSRAYYGAYHAAKYFQESLPSKGNVINPNAGVHEQLIQCLENPSLPRSDPLHNLSKSIGYMLRRVRKYRTDADYEIDLDISFDEAQDALFQAKKIIGKCLSGSL